MTRFTNQSAIEGGKRNGNMVLMTTAACDHDAMGGAMQDARADSLKLLERASSRMADKRLSSDVIRYAHRYFLTDPKGPSDDEKQQIRRIITQTRNGLNGDVTVKVGPDAKAYGYVVNKSGVGATKGYHNMITRSADGNQWRVGAIHIDSDTLEDKDRLSALTLIHEATHKYAGTMDYCYFDNNSRDPDGVFTDKKFALVNADSYAWFILKIGRKRFGQGLSTSMFG